MVCWILGAHRLQFGSHFGSISAALGIWKNSSKCVSVVTFDSLRPSKRSLFACFDRRCVWEADFEQFFAFLANFGDPSGNPFGTDCDKKQGLKKEYKNGRFFGGVTGHCWALLGTVAECGWPAGGGESFRSSHGLLRKGSITPQPGKAWRGGSNSAAAQTATVPFFLMGKVFWNVRVGGHRDAIYSTF